MSGDSAPAREPTIVFVFEIKNWYNTISPLSKLDLMDIVPQVGVQFGFDFQSQAYLLVVTKTKWVVLPPELRRRFMMISRRIKEELDGPLTTVQREQYESSDIFAAFEAQQQGGAPAEKLDAILEAEEPSAEPSAEPAAEPSAEPSAEPAAEPSAESAV